MNHAVMFLLEIGKCLVQILVQTKANLRYAVICQDSTSVKPRQFPSQFFPIHYSPISVPLDAI